MVLLIPASIVTVATLVRVLVSGARGPTSPAGSNAQDDSLLQPLLWVYGLAPIAGAAGALLPFRSSTDGSALHAALVPLVTGVGLALLSGVLFFLFSALERRRSAPADRPPPPASGALLILPGCSALVVALAVCLYYGKISPAAAGNPGKSAPMLSMQWDSGAGVSSSQTVSGADPVPELLIMADNYALDGHSLAADDALFRLTGLAARSHSIILRPAPGVSAVRLAEGLALANQAGFSQVGIDAGAVSAAPTP